MSETPTAKEGEPKCSAPWFKRTRWIGGRKIPRSINRCPGLAEYVNDAGRQVCAWHAGIWLGFTPKRLEVQQ